MAVAAHEVKVVAGKNHAIAVEKKVVVDRDLGIAAEVENIAVAVQLEDGNIGVAHQQRLVGVHALVEDQHRVPIESQTDAAVTADQHQQQTQSQSQNFQRSNYASEVLRLAVLLTYCCLCLLCFWAVMCTAVAWILAITANSTHDAGKYERARILKRCSVCCSILAIVSAITVPFIVVVVLIILLRDHF